MGGKVMEKIPVGILGATGTVGQKFVVLLTEHPMFRVVELVASERSAGKTYREACAWKQATPMPERIAELTVKALGDTLTGKILFSGLDSSVAGEAETRYADGGHIVISNSSNHRMDADVPLTIPEINADHFELAKRQKRDGAILTNSNCSTMFLAMALGPLHREFGLEAAHVTTMQAISGAGYPGVPSIDILGNVVPYIASEEEKLETEAAKILGKLTEAGIEPAGFAISAQCNRVPVFDGHLETVSMKFSSRVTPDDVARCLAEFRGMPQERKLPSAPERPIVVTAEKDRPQPARDIMIENGMATIVGRIRRCPVFDVKMVILGHNTIRGAAGAAVLNAEAYHALGYMP